MNKKNVFSYFMWVIYSLAVGASLFGIAGTLSRQTGFTVELGYGVGAMWLVLSGVIVFLMYKLLGKDTADRDYEAKGWLIAEIVIGLLLIAAGVTLRVLNLASAGEDGSYYAVSIVAEGQKLPSVVHGATYLYLQLLHLIFMLFGNSFVAGVWLQIALCLLAGVAVYFAVRKTAGVVAALLALGFMMAGPLFVEESLMLSPEMLYLLIYAIGLLVVAFVIRGSKRIVPCLLAGVVTGLCTYPDLCGISLVFMLFAGILMRKEEEDIPIGKRVISAFFSLLGAVVSFAAVLFADALLCGESFLHVLDAWWKLYVPETFALPVLTVLVQSSLDVLFLILLMAIGIFSFWCNRKAERQSMWILPAAILILLKCFCMTVAEIDVLTLLYLLMSVLAGVSISAIIHAEDDEEEVAQETRSRKTVRTVSPKEEKPQIQYLENPLPLPKKHEKKTLDFDIVDIEVADDFDIEVSDDDDYDI